RRQDAAGGAKRRTERRPLYLACFANFMKIGKEPLALWREILCRLPQARLLLQDTLPSAERAEILRERMEALGFPSERIRVRPGRANYYADYAEADLMLDPFPYGGGAMTAIALYMGVPVIALAGERFGARFSAAILYAADLSLLIAHDAREYLDIALRWARKEGCAEIEEKLCRIEASPLCACKAYGEDAAQAVRLYLQEKTHHFM
ncbi:MAG: hypothetical protein LUC40_03215, partial [Oscillospiraceae bacterium]|nr:hypothetical protein [Oscillospiraceae bacterium]